ncbi:hypothetical protein GCK72_014493 [Caenorhabditis remanei]|uniref:Proline-rich protein PRCC n=1 Tax=Caenorhabditis remanei TaxID=31234 RepID=A0A6A5GU79_CAERE|nr:hypothetical protein GCK72_014493 [Caenorhabditis remanei]KAF1758035.1 hypothetical protein GCK72_014493 [Caenorhabditis remanei]
MGLVDYAGSDSESDQEEETQQKTSAAPKKSGLLDEDSFFDNSVNSSAADVYNAKNEDVLEEIVQPKDWEKKLAEKARRKLEKKASKKAQKEEKKKEKKLAKKAGKSNKIPKISSGVQKEKGKIVISAFGALAGIAGNNSSDDSDTDEKEVSPVKQKAGLGFLSNLPAPKGRDNRSDGANVFDKSLIPHSVTKKTPVSQPIFTPAPAPKIVEESDEEDDDSTDFFGFSSAPIRKEEISSEVPFMATNSSMDVVGPSRPTEEDEIDPSEMYQMPEEDGPQEGPTASNAWLHRKITDEQAHKLLMRFSHDIGSEERRSINEMANSIVDVNVDDALGPDVKTNIIKNLGHRAFVEATSAPIPQVQTQGQTSRRKHQITYLASLAVAREEQLKDQWAEQKQSKRMARQKYGF